MMIKNHSVRTSDNNLPQLQLPSPPPSSQTHPYNPEPLRHQYRSSPLTSTALSQTLVVQQGLSSNRLALCRRVRAWQRLDRVTCSLVPPVLWGRWVSECQMWEREEPERGKINIYPLTMKCDMLCAGLIISALLEQVRDRGLGR